MRGIVFIQGALCRYSFHVSITRWSFLFLSLLDFCSHSCFSLQFFLLPPFGLDRHHHPDPTVTFLLHPYMQLFQQRICCATARPCAQSLSPVSSLSEVARFLPFFQTCALSSPSSLDPFCVIRLPNPWSVQIDAFSPVSSLCRVGEATQLQIGTTIK